jgi:DNA repair exonuclease SbcCD nuclease subunit
MSRILFIGDPHLKINRFDLATSFLTWLNQLIAEQKPDLVVNLGDTFDTHAVLRSEVLNEFIKHTDHVIGLGIPYVYLLGNHDMYKPNDSKYHAMLPFKDKIKNLYVVDRPIDLFDMTFVPYQHDARNFPTNTLPVVVAHQTFTGADYGPIREAAGVDPSSLADADLVISGHIHKRQQIATGQQSVGGRGATVIYVGSPFSQSASDVDQVKGITIFDMATYAQTFYPTPLPTWRRLVFVVSQHATIETLEALVQQDISGSKDHWVLELQGPKAEIVGYLGSKEYSEAVSGVDVKVKTKFTDSEKRKVSIEAKSMEHIISEFVAKVYNGSVDKEELSSRAKDILNEARLSK